MKLQEYSFALTQLAEKAKYAALTPAEEQTFDRMIDGLVELRYLRARSLAGSVPMDTAPTEAAHVSNVSAPWSDSSGQIPPPILTYSPFTLPPAITSTPIATYTPAPTYSSPMTPVQSALPASTAPPQQPSTKHAESSSQKARVCVRCGATQTSTWRKGPEGRLCNSYVVSRISHYRIRS